MQEHDSGNKNTAIILVVDDDPYIIVALRRLFHSEPYTILSASAGEEALQIMESRRVDLLICDEQMPGIRGSDVLREARNRWPDTIRIVLTGFAEMNVMLRAINEGEAYRFVTKPWHDGELLMIVKQALERGHLLREIRRLASEVEKQRDIIAALEHQYPGIANLNIDSQGYYVASSD